MEGDLRQKFRALELGVRALAASVTLIFGYIDLRVLYGVDTFRNLYANILSGKPLPPFTSWILQAKYPLLVLSWLVLGGVFGVVFRSKDIRNTLFIMAGATLFFFVVPLIVWTALYRPIAGVIQSLGAGG